MYVCRVGVSVCVCLLCLCLCAFCSRSHVSVFLCVFSALSMSHFIFLIGLSIMVDFESRTGPFFNTKHPSLILSNKAATGDNASFFEVQNAKAEATNKFWLTVAYHYACRLGAHISELECQFVCGFFRKLCNCFAGQGESERLNKLVKRFRTNVRNRQSHAMTQAWLELESYFTDKRNSEKPAKACSALQFFKENLSKIDEDIQKAKETEEEDDEHRDKRRRIDEPEDIASAAEEEYEEIDDIWENCLIDLMEMFDEPVSSSSTTGSVPEGEHEELF